MSTLSLILVTMFPLSHHIFGTGPTPSYDNLHNASHGQTHRTTCGHTWLVALVTTGEQLSAALLWLPPSPHVVHHSGQKVLSWQSRSLLDVAFVCPRCLSNIIYWPSYLPDKHLCDFVHTTTHECCWYTLIELLSVFSWYVEWEWNFCIVPFQLLVVGFIVGIKFQWLWIVC